MKIKIEIDRKQKKEIEKWEMNNLLFYRRKKWLTDIVNSKDNFAFRLKTMQSYSHKQHNSNNKETVALYVLDQQNKNDNYLCQSHKYFINRRRE